MNTKQFIVAIVLIGIALLAGVYFSLNRSDATSPSANNVSSQASYTLDDVKVHNSKTSCWTIISGSVYDITSYIPRHPGGDEILRACGADGTTLFTKRETAEGQSVGSGSPHSKNAVGQLDKFKIGTVQLSVHQ